MGQVIFDTLAVMVCFFVIYYIYKSVPNVFRSFEKYAHSSRANVLLGDTPAAEIFQNILHDKKLIKDFCTILYKHYKPREIDETIYMSLLGAKEEGKLEAIEEELKIKFSKYYKE